MKKTRNHSPNFCISFSKPLDLSLTIKKIKIIISDEIQCQSKGQKVNPISNAPILNLITDLECLYNFLSECMHVLKCSVTYVFVQWGF